MEKKVLEVEEIKISNYSDSDNKRSLLEWIKNNRVATVIITFLVCLELIQGFHNKKVLGFLGVVFFNRYDEFQWGGITAIITIISIASTIIVTIRRNRADLVSKSRIEWLQVNKKIMSEYLAELSDYPYEYAQYRRLAMENGNRLQVIEKKEKVDALAQKIQSKHNLLLMNLSDNEDNKQINDCIVVCTEWINSMPERWDNSGANFSYKDTPIVNLMKVARDYYKREWDRAKRGK
ncbi:hypothetical protein [Liquorilactobacillus sp.]|uniref:hypothetical protein n=1 Tax=Liquorilactobacillus sp. TaxID=2767923 RepID=UPI0039EBDAF5